MGSINDAHQADGGVLLFSGELILLYCDSVQCEIKGKGKTKGRIFLTTHRIVFTSSAGQNASVKSFSAPFFAMSTLSLESLSSDSVTGKVFGLKELVFVLNFNVDEAEVFTQLIKDAAERAHANSVVSGCQSLSQCPRPDPDSYNQTTVDDVYKPNHSVGLVLPFQQFNESPPHGLTYVCDIPPPYPGFISSSDSMPAENPSPGTPSKRKIISLRDKLALNGSGKRVLQFRGSFRPSPYHKCPLKKKQDESNEGCSNESTTLELSKASSPQQSDENSPKEAKILETPRPSVSRLPFESVRMEPRIIETSRSSTPQSFNGSDKIDTDIETPSVLKGRSFSESERTDTPSPSTDEAMDGLNDQPLVCSFLSQLEVPTGKTNGLVVDFKTAGNRSISVKGAKLEAIFRSVFKSENIVVKINGEDSGNESYNFDQPKEIEHRLITKRIDCNESNQDVPMDQASSQGTNLSDMDPLPNGLLDELNEPFNSSMDPILDSETDEFLGNIEV